MSITSEAGEMRLLMERTIDRLADRARSDVDPGQFFADILRVAVEPGGAIRVRLWHRSAESAWQLAGENPPGVTQDADFIAEQQIFLTEVSTESRPRILSTLSTGGANGSRQEVWRMLVPIRHSGQTLGILESEHKLSGSGQLPADTIRFFAMISEITADFLAQYELKDLRRSRRIWQNWDRFSQQLWESIKLDSVSAAIVNDGRLITETDRISVLIRYGSSYRLTSVSGVERIEPRSGATRAIESLATSVDLDGRSIWIESSGNIRSEKADPATHERLRRYVTAYGATAVGIVPVYAVPHRSVPTRPVAVLIFDQFKPVDHFVEWMSQAELLANRSAPALRLAIELSEIPWLTFWQQLRRSPSRIGRPSFLMTLIVAIGIILALIFIPADFTIASPGELWPAHRREVFAGTSGIVDKVLVAHGDDVGSGHALILLRDPELETDAPRVAGEIATVNERLKGVQAARFTGSNNVDANSRSRQLAADEEELKERLRTLERQRLLIEERTAALTMRSPIAGKVLTWDVSQHLLARPVERGQSLLTIGDMSGPWIIEARVADKDVGHIHRARKESAASLPVEFMMASDPGRIFHGQIEDVALSSELDESARRYVRVVIAFNAHEIDQPRPGATVISRIHCGRKPLGYVWLHDLFDAIRTRVLF